jgi:transglutaminase-like putative cysteine protease
VTFNWTHTYGPLDWPRNGATLLNIKSDRAHYWKVETLDGFDGFRWLRTPNSGASHDLPGLPPAGRPVGRSWNYFEYNKAWDSQFRVTVRSLSSDLIVGAGITYRVDGAGPVSGSGDGTTIRTSESPLERGDSYTVRAYAPDPTAAQMRAAPGHSEAALLQYTDVLLPQRGESALDSGPGAGFQGRTAVQVPLRDWNAAPDPDVTRALEASRYARTYRLASRITSGQATTYDAVKAMENYLQRNYRYSERPPSAVLPLDAFLFEDKIGYCQQFSGAMALMLRLEGIPARVAAGFSPGSYNRDSGEYRVRDLDAHSWVEVWFNGIGWVPFDPTPAAAPAESQASGLAAVSAAGGAAGEVRSRSQGDALSERAGGAGAGAADPREAGRAWWILLLVPAAGGAGFAAWRTLRRRRRLARCDLAEAQVAELRSALVRLGFSVPAATTLLALERRLARTVGPASARYAAGLRAHRYDPSAPAAPRLSERRAVRRELTARGGPLARLRGVLAIPPAGPRPL